MSKRREFARTALTAKLIGLGLAIFPVLFVVALAEPSWGAIVLITGPLVGIHALWLRLARYGRWRDKPRMSPEMRLKTDVRRHAVGSVLLLDWLVLAVFGLESGRAFTTFIEGWGVFVVGALTCLLGLKFLLRVDGSRAVYAGVMAAFFGVAGWMTVMWTLHGIREGAATVPGEVFHGALFLMTAFSGVIIVIAVDAMILTANWWWPPPVEGTERQAGFSVVRDDGELHQPGRDS